MRFRPIPTRQWWITLVVVASLRTADTTVAQPITPDPDRALSQLITDAGRGSYKTQQLLGAELSARAGARATNKALLPSDSHKAALRLRNSVDRYQHQQRQAELGGWILKGNNLLVQGAIVVGATAAGIAGAPFIAAGSLVAAAGLDEVVSVFGDSQRESARRLAAAAVHQYGRDKGLDDLDDLDGTQLFEKLYADGGGVVPAGVDDIDEDGRAVANGAMIRFLDQVQGATLRELAAQGARIDDLDAHVTENTAGIARVSQCLTEFQKVTEERFLAVQKTLGEINEGLGKINKRIDVNSENIARNSHDIEYLQGFLFGKMDPAEQIAALQSGFFHGMPDAERRDLQKKVDLARKRKGLIDGMNKTVAGAEDLLEIAINLKIPVSPDLANAVEVGSNAANAVTAFASRNYLGAVSAMSNVLGIGGKSAGQQRHEQIMNVLQGLVQGQQKMMEQLDTLQKGQQRMVENQQRIYEAVLQLRRELDQHRQDMRERLADIEHIIMENRIGIRQVLAAEINTCETALRMLRTGGFNYDPEREQFARFDDWRRYYQTSKPYLRTCLKGAGEHVPLSGRQDELFTIRFYNAETYNQEGGTESSISMKDVVENYHQVWRFARSRIEAREGWDLTKALSALLVPVSTLDGLAEKRRAVSESGDPLPARIATRLRPPAALQAVTTVDLLGEPYSAQAVIQYGQYVLAFHQIFELVPEIGSPATLSLQELLDMEFRPETGRFLLEDTLVRVDVALAQYVLLSGDILLEELVPALSDADAEKRKPAVELLKRNPILAQNFAMHIMRDAVERSKQGYLFYHAALSSPGNPWALQDITTGWKFHWAKQQRREASGTVIPAGWSIRIDDLHMPLPSARDLQAGQLRLYPEVAELVELRERMVSEILGYSFVANAPNSEQRELLNRAIVSSGM